MIPYIGARNSLSELPAVYFKGINQYFAKPPLNFNGGLAKLEFTSLVE